MYWQHFGLKEPPFSITPDPDYIYFSKQHQHAYAELLYGIKTRKGFMSLTADIGSGKTTLYRTMLMQMGDGVKSSLVLNPSMSPVQLLQTIVEDFEIEVKRKNRKGLFDALNEFLLQTAREGAVAVLIIDEAHELKRGTLEQIRLLSNFETNKNKLLQIIMVGQPELTSLLAKPSLRQLRQRIAVAARLGPLDREDVEKYVAHRLRVAGGDGMLIFDRATLDDLYDVSGGVPRLINVVADRALLLAYLNETDQDISAMTARMA
ncbi:MAG: AAA family ATPase [Verrucomicrobia bacterium]|nr:AAA family ATPase [Verrucomicrobiota bacterium]